jgi:hypothetical protein
MCPPADYTHLHEPERMARVDDIVGRLKHGEITNRRNGRNRRYETLVIEELEAIAAIYRAITRFDAAFADQKTPHMISFRICAGPRLQAVEVSS